jgi:glycerophosphoryl diester phosphodiesterase
MSARRPLLLGHRGAIRSAPENTIEAFDLALAQGCDGFEFDVRLTRDRQGVICHDPGLGGHEVSRADLADLAAPSLEDVLARFAERAFLDIELKVSGLEAHTAELLKRYPAQRGYCVSSFLPEVLEALYRVDPSLSLGLICKTRRQLAAWASLPVQAVFLHRSLAHANVIQTLKAADRQVFVWTVNLARGMRQFAALAVDGIISDRTELLARTFPPHAGFTKACHASR